MRYLVECLGYSVFILEFYTAFDITKLFLRYNMTDRPCQNARVGVYKDRYMVYQNLPMSLRL